jgi:hypothetical protein
MRDTYASFNSKGVAFDSKQIGEPAATAAERVVGEQSSP